MVQLLVISDDFTGALDTGVQFAGKGMPTKVLGYLPKNSRIWEQSGAQVMVVDARTRHLDGGEAYQRVYELVKSAKRAGVPLIYKKTDSGLRGNIGKELEAALMASGEAYLTFIPALPAMNRITVGGVHYVDGMPIHQTAFGRDPFEPVLSADVMELFRDVPVKTVLYGESGHYERGKDREIGIFDAASETQIRKIAEDLTGQESLGVMAGCAGFASVLGDIMNPDKEQVNIPAVTDSMFVICGSVNEITRRQIEYAEANGMKRITLTPIQQFIPEYLSSPEGREWLCELKRDCEAGVTCVVETGISDMEKVAKYREENQIPLEQARVTISQMLGDVLKELLAMGLETTIMIIGGDTLAGFITKMRCTEITVCGELERGTVLSFAEINGRKQWIISKSGGFGEPDLLMKVEEKVKRR
ncbi:MAG: four-carbon acid sugar kinase family protein [Lachnospiraceae bacterium]|nr:four-carbon acid sugar kinase family protein [Lachnospiraceae bacterium]